MKALRILIMAIAIMMTSGAMAQTVYSSSGSNCGSIRSDGSVYSKSGSSVGKINSDGTVRNGSGSSIGRVSGVPKEWAAAYFFFFFD